MLVRWGTAGPYNALLGYYRVNPMLRSGIPTTSEVQDPFEVSPQEMERLDKAIQELEERYKLVIIRAYMPWKAKSVEGILSSMGTCDRTWRRWLHEAAAGLASKMQREAASIQTKQKGLA